MLQPAGRRASRVATLDGGAVLVDGDWSDSDRTYSVIIYDPNGENRSILIDMMTYFQTAVLSCDDGCYLVLLSGVQYKKGKTTIQAEVIQSY